MIDAQHQMKRGFLWFGSATAVTRIIDLLSTLVILALLSRAEMGVAALSWTVAVVAEAFSGLGVGTSLVQARAINDDELDSLFWFATAVGLGMLVLMAAAGPAIAWYYNEPVLAGMVAVSGLKLVFVSTGLVPLQLMNRELRFKEISALQAISTLGEALTKVGLAALGLGAWALVIANALRGLYLLVGTAAIGRWRPRFHYHFNDIRTHVAFGLRASTSRILFHFYRNADALVIGRMLGMEALGLYRVASEVAMSADEAVLQVVRRVAYPVFARVAHDTHLLAETFLRMTRYLIYLTGPISVFLCFAADDLLAVITTERWRAAAPLVQVLCFGGFLRGLSQLFPELLLAGGRPMLALVDSLVSMVVLFGLFVLAAHLFPEHRSMAVALAWFVAYPILLVCLNLYARFVVPMGLLVYLRNLGGGLVGMAVVATALFGAQQVTAQLPYAPQRLGVLAAVGFAATAAFLRFGLGMGLRDVLPKAPPKEAV